MTESKGKQRSWSKPKVIKYTDIEKELADLNLDFVYEQLEAIQKQFEFQQKAFQTLQPVLDQTLMEQKIQADLYTPEQIKQQLLDDQARRDKLTAAQDELLEYQLNMIRQGTGATEEQKSLINQATEAQIARGEQDIIDFGRNALDMISGELAPSRGLRPTDTPIQDRAFQLGGEMSRQQGRLVSDLRGAQAQAELNFPLAANAQQAAFGQFQQQLAQSSQDFQNQLQQQAFQNRLNLFGQTGQLGLGLASLQPFANLQQAFKPIVGTQQQSSQNQKSAGFSSRRLKRNMRKVDTAQILDALIHIPVEKWEYIYPGRGEHGDHIGTYAEDFQNAFGVSDGVTINFMDAIGVLMASIQALHDKIQRLENDNDSSHRKQRLGDIPTGVA